MWKKQKCSGLTEPVVILSCLVVKETWSILGKISSYTNRKALEQVSRGVRKSLSLEALTNEENQVMALTRVKHSPHPLWVHAWAVKWATTKPTPQTNTSTGRIRIIFSRKLTWSNSRSEESSCPGTISVSISDITFVFPRTISSSLRSRAI